MQAMVFDGPPGAPLVAGPFEPSGSFGFGGLPLDLQVQLDLTGGTECLAYTASVSIDCTPAP